MPVASSTRLTERFNPQVLATLDSLYFKARYVVEGFLNGLHGSPYHGFSVEFSDYRDYQPGDDLRRLDWRLYARTDRLCIKRYMQETNTRFYLLCDTSASMAYCGSRAWASKLECAKILAMAMTWFMLKQNDAAGLVALTGPNSTPHFVRPSQRSTQFGLILRELEQMQAAGPGALENLLQQADRLVHRRSIILIFSDLLDSAESIADELRHLRFDGHECLIFQTLDPDEIDFPFTEPQIFEDPETGVRRSITPRAAREKYLARFQEFMRRHRDLFRSLEIPHCLVRTDQDPWPVLGRFLAERKRKQ